MTQDAAPETIECDTEEMTLLEASHGIDAEQYKTLMRPLNGTRVAKRQQGGKNLSYLESWDVRAHLIRVFGFGNFDVELVDYGYVGQREYTSQQSKPMIEVIWRAKVQLTLRNKHGVRIARYTEGAVGSASGPDNMAGDHHDNALKTAESDALKRCAINLGTQFGLSLYNDGSTKDVVKATIIKPDGVQEEKREITPEQAAALNKSVGTNSGQEATNV